MAKVRFMFSGIADAAQFSSALTAAIAGCFSDCDAHGAATGSVEVEFDADRFQEYIKVIRVDTQRTRYETTAGSIYNLKG